MRRNSLQPIGFALITLFLVGNSIFAQYKSEAAGPPPQGLASGIVGALQKEGIKISADGGSAFCEVWFRTSLTSGAKSSEEGVTLSIPHGTLLGAIRFPAQGADRRGQTIKSGVYTLRYSLQPLNGDHLGVSPQRDFAVLVPAAEDKDLNATPAFDPLMEMSKKASGTPHPAVLSIWNSSAEKFPSFGKEGDHDWVLNVKIGDIPVAIILVGKAES